MPIPLKQRWPKQGVLLKRPQPRQKPPEFKPKQWHKHRQNTKHSWKPKPLSKHAHKSHQLPLLRPKLRAHPQLELHLQHHHL